MFCGRSEFASHIYIYITFLFIICSGCFESSQFGSFFYFCWSVVQLLMWPDGGYLEISVWNVHAIVVHAILVWEHRGPIYRVQKVYSKAIFFLCIVASKKMSSVFIVTISVFFYGLSRMKKDAYFALFQFNLLYHIQYLPIFEIHVWYAYDLWNLNFIYSFFFFHFSLHAFLLFLFIFTLLMVKLVICLYTVMLLLSS